MIDRDGADDEQIVDLVVPTIGRPSLAVLLRTIASGGGPLPARVVVVDDRPHAPGPLVLGELEPAVARRLLVLRSGGRGPAAARNVGWRRARSPWVAFLDDDVVVPPDWLPLLDDDLRSAQQDVAASQGSIHVPLPTDRRPTDWERNVAGLEHARWATADMAYRRDVLQAVGGFDERFTSAYREDADLGLRVTGAGWRIAAGRRHLIHPVRPAPHLISIRLQSGNAEDPFMRALHGRRWRRRAGVPQGRRHWHLATVAAAGTAALAAVAGDRRLSGAATAAWAALTTDFARRRIAPGPRDAAEVVRMALTSIAIPFAATWHLARGWATVRRRLATPGPAPMPVRVLSAADPPMGVLPAAGLPVAVPQAAGSPMAMLPAAVLFDRDGTLVHDVPYNGDPALVSPVAGAREVLQRLRDHGVATGVVSNQSGVGRGLLDLAQVEAVNRRIDGLLGPFDVWQICPHAPQDGCSCRKPGPGMIQRAAAALGVDPRDCVVVGDIGADVQAALAAGARPILVPTAVTRAEEIAAAPEVAHDLAGALQLVMNGRTP